MTKQQFGPQPWLFPNPTVLVGTMINGKPNVAAYAWSGITGGDPPTISVGVRHSRYTLEGILQNRTFSVNIPSADLIKETDYCGIVSGRDTDKIADCGFTVAYGKLDTAPLIEQCPVNLECEVLHILNVGIHAL
ncbi:MAG: flavin reductase family protein, partial [Dehalococcoidales bacterium]|nr:flavin reductase family protein [Dehalococcoidales bacterium]